MQLPMISFKMAAVSLISAQLITQALAIPVNSQHRSELEVRNLSGILIGSLGTHLYHKSKENKKEEQADKAEIEKKDKELKELKEAIEAKEKGQAAAGKTEK